MKPQRHLYLSAQQLAAYRWHAGSLYGEGRFADSEAGLQQFGAYLASNTSSVFSLLVNVAEEGFHIATIPFLRGRDRAVVIQRKLAQTFFNTPLSASLSLGHEKSRRKDENLLLAALTNPAFFQPWLDVIQQTNTALSGVFSLPTILPSLLKRLRLPDEPCLLLTVQDQSIRQSYFEKGQLHFSRLTPLQHSSIGSIAQGFASESIKLQQYLASQRLVGRNQTITAHILAHPGAQKTIENSCVDTPAVRFNVLDIAECAKRAGLKSPPADSHSETLFLHLLATNPPSMQFAGDTLRHTYQVGRLGTLLYGLGATSLCACLLFSGNQLFDAYQFSQESEELHAETGQSRQRYADVIKTFPSVPIDNEALKSLVGRYLALEQRSISPTPFYVELSHALQDHPAIELVSLAWKLGGAEPASGTTGRPDIGTRPVPDDSESLVVQGALHSPPGADTRQLLGTFNRFVEQLSSNEELRVAILQQPFDIESGKALRSGDASPERNASRSFSLQVTRKIGS
jgi:hypothetical protein